MPQGFKRAAGVALLAQFCTIAWAFQSSEGPIETIPRAAPKASSPVLRVDSSLVLIPVHVIKADGETVTDLKKEDFELFEDGVRQTITHFTQDDAPVSAGVILDVSGSMRKKMGKAAEAAAEFFKFANPEDEFFLVEFNGRARLTVPFTRDWSAIFSEILTAKAWGMTAMLDGIHLAAEQMKNARHMRKALVVVSDGGDNFSRRSLRELKARLIESDVQVYSLGVFDRNYTAKHTPEERNGPTLLDQVALDTGGHTFPVTLDALPEIGAQIAHELRNQYVLGYSPASPTTDGKYHKVNLKLSTPNAETVMRTYYRQGYYAPGQ
jgi:Ca-activated chloride channel homolog